MGRTWNQEADPTWGVAAAVAAGMPPGPLAIAQRFHRGESPKGKLHIDYWCGPNRLDRIEDVDFTTITADRLCTRCVDGPISDAAKDHIKAWRTVVEATTKLARARAGLIAAARGVPVEELVETDQALARAWQRPLDVTRASWAQVNEAQAVVRLLESVTTAEGTHIDLLDYVAPLHTAASALHTALRHAAQAGNDDRELIRQVVLDLMEQHYSHDSRKKLAGKGWPDLKAADFPALCASEYSFSSGDARGFKGLVRDAWTVWRAHVQATGDLPGAGTAALADTKIEHLEPGQVGQLKPAGDPWTTYEPGMTPWQWAVAEWRAHTQAELATVVALWAERFAAELAQAATEPAQIVHLQNWGHKDRSSIDPGAQLIAQMDLVTNTAYTEALFIAPGPVARWLDRFGTAGSADKSAGHHTNRPVVHLLGPAGDSDDADMLQVAFTLHQPGTGRWREPLAELAAAVTAAQGICA